MSAALFARLLLWLWFGAAVAAGHFLVLARLPAFAMQGVLAGTTLVLLYAYVRFSGVRGWIDSIDLRALVLLHVSRFVGIYFLILHQRGELPRAFAVPGGIGDIIVATMALPVALAPLDPPLRRRAILIWNVVGFFDILMVIITATRLNLEHPGQLRALTYLPLSLLPTFLVPLIIATHVFIFVRIAREQRPA
jgi:hypothetical protein